MNEETNRPERSEQLKVLSVTCCNGFFRLMIYRGVGDETGVERFIRECFEKWDFQLRKPDPERDGNFWTFEVYGNEVNRLLEELEKSPYFFVHNPTTASI
ncbi:MAG: hypothetical protein WD065_12225 [Planctomycetaceae bacterium]